jgi:hypothetical protein
VVEQHTLQIDDTMRFHGQRVTGDVARVGGHYYSDKAPGLALAAIAPVAIAHPFVARPSSREGIAVLSYIATIVTAAVPGAVTALLIFFVAGALGASRGAAALAAAVFGVGSPAWGYSTLLYGHALATACLMAAFAAAVALGDETSPRRDWLLALTVGLGAGWATITEYPTAIPAAVTAVFAIASSAGRGRQSVGRVLLGVTAGAVVCLAILLAFNMLSFGAPFSLGYSNEESFAGMTQGFFGLTYPKRGVLMELLFGQFRGLLFFAPVFVAAPFGFVLLVRHRSSRLPGLAAAAIAFYYVVFNASYYYWDGGWSFGPRHMAPALPFLSLALAPLWSLRTRWLRLVLGALALYGFAVALIAVSTTAQPPDTYHKPLTDLFWPNFSKGRVSINWQSFVEDNLREDREPIAHAWNLGERAGLTGFASLLPLFVSWLAIGLLWWRIESRDGPVSYEASRLRET